MAATGGKYTIKAFLNYAFKLCFLNVWSLHRHIEDIRKDLNYSTIGLNIFSETRLCH